MNQALFDAIRKNLRADIPLIELDANINDPVFAARAALELLSTIKTKTAERATS